MKLLLILSVFVVASVCSGCGGPPAESRKTTTDQSQETYESPMDKAENVEDVLQDSADARNAAIEESSD